MEDVLKPGKTTYYTRRVGPADLAHFDEQKVHDVYATFALARDAEWTTRQFILPLLGDKFEGVGTYVKVRHLAPAFPGEQITFSGVIYAYADSELHCTFEAYVGERKIADGKTGQKIVDKHRLNEYFSQIQGEKG